MAVTWEITNIDPIDIDIYVASITAVRTDGEGNVDTYRVPKAIIETIPQQTAVMNEVLAKRAVDKAKKIAVADFVDSRKAAGKAYLELHDAG